MCISTSYSPMANSGEQSSHRNSQAQAVLLLCLLAGRVLLARDTADADSMVAPKIYDSYTKP